LAIAYYRKLESLVAETERLAVAAQTDTENYSKIYKIYSNSQILLKIVEIIKSIANKKYLQQIQVVYKTIRYYRIRLQLY